VNVKDTGIGVKEADISKLFKLFGCLEDTTHLNTQGVGLGLTICKSIIEQLGGEINIDSSYTQGAKFFFTIIDFRDDHNHSDSFEQDEQIN
jgi:signal transduction histidine kinase